MNKSVLSRAMTHDGTARIIVADTSEIVQRSHEIHKLSKTMTAALGRSLTAASLMGSLLKNDTDSLTLRFKGDGPAGTICCVSDYKGNVRGYADNPSAELPPNSKGKLDVGGAVGSGTMYVIKDMGLEEPYVGMSDIVSGEIAEDITQYFAASEQIPTVCALGVRVNTDFSCKAAGGFLIQLMPFPDDEVVARIESNISKVPSVSQLFADGLTVQQVMEVVLDGVEFDMFDETEISYKCTCGREKYYKALISLGKEELEKLRSDDTPVETKCSFCGAQYTFELSEIDDMLRTAK